MPQDVVGPRNVTQTLRQATVKVDIVVRYSTLTPQSIGSTSIPTKFHSRCRAPPRQHLLRPRCSVVVSSGSFTTSSAPRKRFSYTLLQFSGSRLTKLALQLMHAGVIRDEERSRIKRERQLDFDVQGELEKKFKKSQPVTPVPVAESPPGSGGADGKS